MKRFELGLVVGFVIVGLVFWFCFLASCPDLLTTALLLPMDWMKGVEA